MNSGRLPATPGEVATFGGGAGAAQDRPLVSVVIPCYNHARFLGEAIESALGQTYPHVEVVVVDDGSTDDTGAVASRYPSVRYVRQENQGLSGARNTGLRASTGAFVVFLDADDRLLPKAVEAGLGGFRTHPESVFVYGAYNWINVDGSFHDEGWASRAVRGDHYAEMLRCSFIAMHATVLFRREAVEAVGGFDAALRACEDYDLYLRITRQGSVQYHGEVVAEYRGHGHNMSGNDALMLRVSLQVLRAQWPHVRRDRALAEAYRAGRRFWKECYGQRLSERLDRLWRQGHVGQALREEGVLIRYAPSWFFRHLKRNAMRGAARLARAVLPAPA